MIQEIAIRKIKAGQSEAFEAAREKFISKLLESEGIEKDWEFKSFFTMPTPDETDVYVGMTRYDSAETTKRISEEMMSSQEAANFFATFDMKAFSLCVPKNNIIFKLEDKIKDGNVLEVAIREPLEGKEDLFEEKRNAFFSLVSKQPGYKFDQEFIDVQSGSRVVLIGWESISHFQDALGILQTKPEMGEFFGVIKVHAYQALTEV